MAPIKRPSWLPEVSTANLQACCGSCGAINRVRAHSVSLRPKCGKCGALLDESYFQKNLPFIPRSRNARFAVIALAVAIGVVGFGVSMDAINRTAGVAENAVVPKESVPAPVSPPVLADAIRPVPPTPRQSVTAMKPLPVF